MGWGGGEEGSGLTWQRGVKGLLSPLRGIDGVTVLRWEEMREGEDEMRR
jgi:hypothetical protein